MRTKPSFAPVGGLSPDGTVNTLSLKVEDECQSERFLILSSLVGEAWPHLQQICRVERRRTLKGRVRVEVSYAVTSLSPTVAGADRLLRILREHWHIENRVHWVRDVTFDEDRSQIRTASAPQVMAALRNLTTTLVRWAGHSNVAAALRRHAAHLSEALALLGIACYPGK